MDLLRKHYEKVILTVVLVGLAVVAAYLPIKVASVNQALRDATAQYIEPRAQPLEPLDLGTNQTVLRRVANPKPPPFATGNHTLFNPIKWEKRRDGTLIPMEDAGLRSLAITEIKPLYLRVQFEGVRKGSSSTLRYIFVVENQAATGRSAQRPRRRSVAPGGKFDIFVIESVEGPEDNPEAIILDVPDAKAKVKLSVDTPFQEIGGYSASLRHLVENRSFANQRVGGKIIVAGTPYNIIAIGPEDVTLEDEQTKKRTRIQKESGQ